MVERLYGTLNDEILPGLAQRGVRIVPLAGLEPGPRAGEIESRSGVGPPWILDAPQAARAPTFAWPREEQKEPQAIFFARHVARHFPSARRVPDVDGLLEVERLHQGRKVVGVGVHVVAVPGWLERPWPRRSWAMQR
jgi:hypothetical protein